MSAQPEQQLSHRDSLHIGQAEETNETKANHASAALVAWHRLWDRLFLPVPIETPMEAGDTNHDEKANNR